MSHILLLDHAKATMQKLGETVGNIIREKELQCHHFFHAMAVSSDHLPDLQILSKHTHGKIISNLRVYSINPHSKTPHDQPIIQRENLKAVGRYDYTNPNSYGNGIVVANIDDGVYTTHPEFKDRYLGYWFGIDSKTGKAVINTTPGKWVSEHGTHTMGTMCGKTVGVLNQAKFTFMKLFNSGGADLMDMFKLVDLLLTKYNENPEQYPLPHVINCSFGTDMPDGLPLTSPVYAQYSVALQHMYDAFHQYGCLFLFAAGNSGEDGNPIEMPAFFNNSISVGSVATQSNGSLVPSTFSSYGPCLNAHDIPIDTIGKTCPLFAAPGEDVLSSVPPDFSLGGYAKLSGTSMATPCAAGIVGAIYSILLANGTTRLEAHKKIFDAIRKTSTFKDLNNPTQCGFGLITLPLLVKALGL
jgi:subtilisin family serine protease